MAYKVEDIANKIIQKATSADGGDPITNLKLQKLLYYMQGFHLAYFDTPLFEEDIEAWMYGPVIPDVYKKYKDCGSSGLSITDESIITLAEKEERLFEEVFEVYGDYSAIGLMNLTHQEPPWKNVPTGAGSIISKESMNVFFKTRIE